MRSLEREKMMYLLIGPLSWSIFFIWSQGLHHMFSTSPIVRGIVEDSSTWNDGPMNKFPCCRHPKFPIWNSLTNESISDRKNVTDQWFDFPIWNDGLDSRVSSRLWRDNTRLPTYAHACVCVCVCVCVSMYCTNIYIYAFKMARVKLPELGELLDPMLKKPLWQSRTHYLCTNDCAYSLDYVGQCSRNICGPLPFHSICTNDRSYNYECTSRQGHNKCLSCWRILWELHT